MFAKIALFTFFLSFIFIRVYNKDSILMLPKEGDDGGYFIYSEVFFRTHTFDWCAKELSTNYFCGSTPEKSLNRYSPGPALTLVPFHALGLGLQKIGLLDPKIDVLQFWSVVGTFGIFLLSLFFLFDFSTIILEDKKSAFWFTIFFALGNPVLYFVFRRPLMAHVTELFWTTTLFAFCARAYLDRTKRSLYFYSLAGFSAAMIVVTRYNNLFILALLGLWVLKDFKFNPRLTFKRIFFLSLGSVIPFLVLVAILQATHMLGAMSSYDSQNLNTANMLGIHSYSFLRIIGFLVGPHWGMIWIMPFTLMELYLIVKARNSLKPFVLSRSVFDLLAALVLFIQFLMMGNYPSDGMSYGSRLVFVLFYLFFAAAVIAARKISFRWSKPWIFLCSFFCLIATFHLLNFESNDSTLTLTVGPLSEGGIYNQGWSDLKSLRAPRFAFHSLEASLNGNPARAIVVSPLFSYFLMAIKDTSLSKLGVVEKGIAYYTSPKRKIQSLADLGLLFQFQLAMAFIAVLLASCFTLFFRITDN